MNGVDTRIITGIYLLLHFGYISCCFKAYFTQGSHEKSCFVTSVAVTVVVTAVVFGDAVTTLLCTGVPTLNAVPVAPPR